MNSFTLSENDYWKSTLKSVDTTLIMLLAFGGKHIKEIDTAITSLRNILTMGDDFDKTKRRSQHQKQDNNNWTRMPYHPFNEIAVAEDQYQRRLQRAIERSIKDYNKQRSEYCDISEEYGFDERQFEQDVEAAIDLSLKGEIKINKAHQMETHDDATAAPAEKEDDSVINEKHDNDELASHTTLKQEKSVKISNCGASHSNWSNYDPLFESDESFSNKGYLTWASHSANDDKLNRKAIETRPELLLDDLVFPTVSAPVPIRHNVPAILQAQEQKMMNVLQPQLSVPQISNRQSQPPYQTPRQYRQQAEQQQKCQRRYQQERLPQPVKFTPRGEDFITTETASISSSERSSQVNVPKAAATGFEGKPSKMKAIIDLSIRGVLGSQQKPFEWVSDSSGASSWTSFAASTDTNWKQGIDTTISDWEKEQAKKQTETPKLPKPASQSRLEAADNNSSCLIEPGTYICNDLVSIEDTEEQDNWTKQEERPDTMVIFIPNHPAKKSKGPRIFCPDDGDFEDDNDEEEDGEANV